jgi:hypothetical protein
MRLLTILAFAILGGACGGAGVQVRNRSAVRLDDVVISANGRSATIEKVESQAEERTSICPKGEAGTLGVSFRANGQVHTSEQALYFECDRLYVIRVEVSTDLQVVATASIK